MPPDVEPDRRVEGRHLVEQDVGELGLEGLGVLHGGEVAALPAPGRDRPGHARDHLLDRALPGGRAELAAEVLLGHDVGRVLRPALRKFDVALLEGDLPAMADPSVAQLPFDRLVGMLSGDGEVATHREPLTRHKSGICRGVRGELHTDWLLSCSADPRLTRPPGRREPDCESLRMPRTEKPRHGASPRGTCVPLILLRAEPSTRARAARCEVSVITRRHALRTLRTMRLLVTGGAGYIGSIVAQRLIGQGHKVVVLDNLKQGHREAVPDGTELIVADLLDPDAVGPVLASGFDGVLHFAALALVAESVAHPERYYRTNVGGTLNLLEAMWAVGVRRLVFSSTAAVYGEPREVPIPEAAPTLPTNTYGRSKLAVDWMIGDFCPAHGLGAISLRYFNVAGASDGLGEDHEPETHLIPNILRAAMGSRPFVEVYGTDYPTPDGTAIRDYVHIDDLATAHLLALDATRAGEHQIFNLGNGSGFSVREVIRAAAVVTGGEIPTRETARRPGDPAMLVAASDRIRSELRWETRRSGLEQIMADAW